MPKQERRNHWYDGRIYNCLIDPAIEDTRNLISSLIENRSKVIDIGSGTGTLAMHLSRKCSFILSIDLSEKMIEYANSVKVENNISNVEFIQGNAAKISEFTNERFDYAVFSLSLHEMESETRQKVLRDIKKVSDRVIIYDYIVHTSHTVQGAINSFNEFLAGKSHCQNYRSFQKENGIYGLLEKNEFKVEKTFIHKGNYAVVKARCK
jgi:SAM-dependent methyltransferase